MAAAAAAGNFAKMAAGGMAVAAQAVGRVAQRVAAVSAAFAGGLIFKGMQGTQEAERMAGAWGLVSRVVATLFLPVIRAATQAVIELVKWWVGLDAGTKDQIQTWILWGAAAIGALAALPLIVKGVQGITAVVGLLLNKWLLVPTAIAAVGFAIEKLSKESGLFLDETGEKIGLLTAAYRGWAGIIGGVGTKLRGGDFDEGFRKFSGITERMDALTKKTRDAALSTRLPGMKGGPGQPGGGIGVPVKIGDKPPEQEANDWLGRIMDQLQNRGPLHQQVKVEISGLQESWNKLQTMQQQTDPQIGLLEKLIDLGAQQVQELRKKKAAPPPVGS